MRVQVKQFQTVKLKYALEKAGLQCMFNYVIIVAIKLLK